MLIQETFVQEESTYLFCIPMYSVCRRNIYSLECVSFILKFYMYTVNISIQIRVCKIQPQSFILPFIRQTLLTCSIEPIVISLFACRSVPIVLVGNKTDLHMERAISSEDGKRLADNWKAAFLETSAKQNEVRNTFDLSVANV